MGGEARARRGMGMEAGEGVVAVGKSLFLRLRDALSSF